MARSWGSKFRWDLAGRGKGSDNAATRAFMGSTVTDVVGNADKAVVAGRTAEEFQKQVEWDYGMMADKAHAVGFDAYAKRLEISFGELPDDVAEAMGRGYLLKLREATAGMTNLDWAMDRRST